MNNLNSLINNNHKKSIDTLINETNVNTEDFKNAIITLKLDNPEDLINSFSGYSAKGKTDKELFNDLRRLAVLNLQANKGYMNYAAKLNPEKNNLIYKIKDNVIKQIILENPKGIKIKTNLENGSENVPDILYFEKDGKQISFHIYGYANDGYEYKSDKIPESVLRSAVKNQESEGVWNERPGDYLIEDYNLIKKLAKIRKVSKKLSKEYEELREKDEKDFYARTQYFKNKLRNEFYFDDRALNYPIDSEVFKNQKEEKLKMYESDINRSKSWKMEEYEKKIANAKTTPTKKKYISLLEQEKENFEKQKKERKEKYERIKKTIAAYENEQQNYRLFNVSKDGSLELKNLSNMIDKLGKKEDLLIKEIERKPEFIKKALL